MPQLRVLTTPLGDWTRRASCRGIDPELFFEERSRPLVKLVCDHCPVASECLEDAMAFEVPGWRYGIWGGTTPRDREQLHRKRKKLR